LHDENQAGYQERLLRQQLREGEVLDGVFLVALHGTAAVTSERLLVVRPTKANGWELKSLPWRLVTAMTVEATTVEATSHELLVESLLHLHYDAPTKTGTRGGNPLHPPLALAAEAPAHADPPGEMMLRLTADCQHLTMLLRARLAHVPGL